MQDSISSKVFRKTISSSQRVNVSSCKDQTGSYSSLFISHCMWNPSRGPRSRVCTQCLFCCFFLCITKCLFLRVVSPVIYSQLRYLFLGFRNHFTFSPFIKTPFYNLLIHRLPGYSLRFVSSYVHRFASINAVYNKLCRMNIVLGNVLKRL